MDKLDFLGGETPADAITPAETTDAIEQAEGSARGPDGRFISTAPEPEPQPEPVAEPEPAPASQPPPEPGHVPLSAVLDEREKRQAAERELAQLRAQHQPQAPQQPDPYEDPAAYTQSVALNIKLDLSEDMARGKHGDALVDQARDWALAKMGQSPAFNQEVLSNRNPYEFAVQAFQRDQIVSQLQPADLAAFKAWQAAQAALQTTPALAAATPQPVAAPPRSLASATSAGGAQAVPTGEGQAFDSLFRK